jgi:hypothetical protein
VNTFERSEISEVHIYNAVHERTGPERPKRTMDNVRPVNERKPDGTQTFGPAGLWKTLFKAWNDREGWFKTTKAMELPGYGVLIQTTNNENGQICDDSEKVPGLKLEPNGDGSYRLVPGIPDAV